MGNPTVMMVEPGRVHWARPISCWVGIKGETWTVAGGPGSSGTREAAAGPRAARDMASEMLPALHLFPFLEPGPPPARWPVNFHLFLRLSATPRQQQVSYSRKNKKYTWFLLFSSLSVPGGWSLHFWHPWLGTWPSPAAGPLRTSQTCSLLQ